MEIVFLIGRCDSQSPKMENFSSNRSEFRQISATKENEMTNKPLILDMEKQIIDVKRHFLVLGRHLQGCSTFDGDLCPGQ
jgi:hypothetical protein